MSIKRRRTRFWRRNWKQRNLMEIWKYCVFQSLLCLIFILFWNIIVEFLRVWFMVLSYSNCISSEMYWNVGFDNEMYWYVGFDNEMNWNVQFGIIDSTNIYFGLNWTIHNLTVPKLKKCEFGLIGHYRLLMTVHNLH